MLGFLAHCSHGPTGCGDPVGGSGSYWLGSLSIRVPRGDFEKGSQKHGLALAWELSESGQISDWASCNFF